VDFFVNVPVARLSSRDTPGRPREPDRPLRGFDGARHHDHVESLSLLVYATSKHLSRLGRAHWAVIASAVLSSRFSESRRERVAMVSWDIFRSAPDAANVCGSSSLSCYRTFFLLTCTCSRCRLLVSRRG